MIEIEMLLTFVYFFECTVVKWIAIFWFQIHITNGLNFMYRKWHTGNQYMVKSAENRMRSNLELLSVMNVKSRPQYISIEILLTFVYFLECTAVECKDALSIHWNRHGHECSRIWKLSANFTLIQCIKISTAVHSKKYTKVSKISISIIPRTCMI
jgi:hypothetical protein